MKIIIINNLYSPWVRGGAERIVEKTTEGLEKSAHDVFIITTAPKESRTDRAHYLPSIYYNLDKYPLWQRFFWHIFDIFNFLNCFKIKDILAEKRPDLVITHNLQGVGYLLPRLLRKMKIKHFHTLHDIQLLHPSGLMFWGKEKILKSIPAKIYQAVMRFLLDSPAVVISPSQWLLSEHENAGFFKGSKRIVLPNYFAEKIIPDRSREDGVNTPFRFLYVGLLEKHKGIKFFCDAFKDFLKENADVKAELSVVGGGAQLEELKVAIGEMKEIHILGRKNESEVEELMLSSNCLVVPSLCYENSPTVIYEAIAAGLPVLGANLGGIPELIDVAGGILFEPGNKEDLIRNIREIIADPDRLNLITIKEKPYHSIDYISELVRLANEVKSV